MAMTPLEVMPVRRLSVALKSSPRNCSLDQMDQSDLALELRSVLRYLQFFGCFPIQLVKKGKGGKHWRFRSKVLSLQSALPIFAAAFFTLIWVKYVAELGFTSSLLGDSIKDAKRYFYNFTNAQESSESDCGGCIIVAKIWKAGAFIYPAYYVSLMFMTWIDGPKFAKLLNEWVNLDKEFYGACCWTAWFKEVTLGKEELHCGANVLIDLNRWKRGFYLRNVVMPVIVVYMLYIYTNVHYKEIMEWLVMAPLGLHFIVFPHLMAMTSVLMYRVMANAFHQTGSAITSAIQSGQWDLNMVTSWRCYIEKLRKQCQLLSTAFSHIEFLSLGSVFVQVTTATFTILNGNRESVYATAVMTILAVFMIAHLLLLLHKVCAAERITREEANIAAFMATVTSRDPVVMQEVKFIYDMITTQPSEIFVGNCVTLSRKLILSLIGQVSTYLIVLMQSAQK